MTKPAPRCVTLHYAITEKFVFETSETLFAALAQRLICRLAKGMERKAPRLPLPSFRFPNTDIQLSKYSPFVLRFLIVCWEQQICRWWKSKLAKILVFILWRPHSNRVAQVDFNDVDTRSVKAACFLSCLGIDTSIAARTAYRISAFTWSKIQPEKVAISLGFLSRIYTYSQKTFVTSKVAARHEIYLLGARQREGSRGWNEKSGIIDSVNA